MNEQEIQNLLQSSFKTLSIQDLAWSVKCSMCDYEKHYEIEPGQSIGNVLGFFFSMYCCICPKCKGKGLTHAD